MSKVGSFLKRHRLWVGFLATFLPLLLLLGLQYVWLVRLQETSAIAHRTTLSNYLEAVTAKIDYFYRSQAERALAIPPSYFDKDSPRRAARHFQKRSVEGARETFILDFVREEYGSLFFYDASSPTMIKKEQRAEIRAIYAACVPLRVLSYEGTPLESESLMVDERDPGNRIIVAPIIGDSAQLVGAAGVILDERYFKAVLLPEIIEKFLERYFPDNAHAHFIVTVRDGRNRLIYASDAVEESEDMVTRNIPYVFTDWSIGIQSRYLTSEQWASANFAINITLSILLGVGLMGGMIFALRAASRAMKLSEMKSDFVSNVSHELRTPLASIRVFGEFLRLGRADNPEKGREYGEYIETESRRLTQLINNILDFSRIESEQRTYRFERADLGELVEDVLKTFQVRLKHAGFQVELTKPEVPLPPVQIDREAIAQAFNNLMDNAVKYSGDSRRIEVVMAVEDRFIKVSVRDFGIGISKGDERRIFERFHRVSRGLVHDVKGSGLGLSIVKHVVTAHGGKVNVESEQGKGSTFFIRLPVDPTAETEAAPADAPPGVEPEFKFDPGTRR